VWQRAVYSGKLESLEILWSWAKEVALSPDELLLAQNELGCTILHMASEKNHVEILNKLWVWAEKAQQNPKELNKKLLLTKDICGNTT